MIPKKIHYIWFGTSKHPKIILKCLKSWKENLHNYDLHKWNEANVELDCDFARQAFKEKKWAFLSDYIRLKVLYEHGGIYLDTDMLVIKSFDNLINNSFFVGKETDDIVNGAIIGAKKRSEFIKLLIDYYRGISLDEVRPIPLIITELYAKYEGSEKIDIYPIDYFYPYPYESSYKFKINPKSFATKNTHAIHLWHKSWKTDLNRYYKAGNHVGGLTILLKMLSKKPTSKKLWLRLPGTLKLTLKQLWNLI